VTIPVCPLHLSLNLVPPADPTRPLSAIDW